MKIIHELSGAYSSKVELGVFKISSASEEDWEQVIDFTKIKKGGVSAKELLKRL